MRLLLAYLLKGAKVVLGARRTEKLQAIVHDIRAEGGQAEFIGMDITKPHEVQALIEKALSIWSNRCIGKQCWINVYCTIK